MKIGNEQQLLDLQLISKKLKWIDRKELNSNAKHGNIRRLLKLYKVNIKSYDRFQKEISNFSLF